MFYISIHTRYFLVYNGKSDYGPMLALLAEAFEVPLSLREHVRYTLAQKLQEPKTDITLRHEQN